MRCVCWRVPLDDAPRLSFLVPPCIQFFALPTPFPGLCRRRMWPHAIPAARRFSPPPPTPHVSATGRLRLTPLLSLSSAAVRLCPCRRHASTFARSHMFCRRSLPPPLHAFGAARRRRCTSPPTRDSDTARRTASPALTIVCRVAHAEAPAVQQRRAGPTVRTPCPPHLKASLSSNQRAASSLRVSRVRKITE